MLKFRMQMPQAGKYDTEHRRVGWHSAPTTQNRYVYLFYVEGVATEQRNYRANWHLAEVIYLHSKTKSTKVRVSEEGYPLNSITTENNKINGRYKEWDLQGNLLLTVNVRNGIINGVLKFYNSNGRVEESVRIVKGKINGFLKTYYTTGELHTMLEVKKDKVSSTTSTYCKEGSLLSAKGNIVNSNILSSRFIKFWSTRKTNQTFCKERNRVPFMGKIQGFSGINLDIDLTYTDGTVTWVA